MENIKLKHSKLGSTAKKISALCAAGLLFLTPLSAKSNTKNLNPKKQIENIAKESKKSQNTIDSFQASRAKAIRIFTMSHPIQTLKTKTISNEEVNNQLVELYTQNIAELLNVANVYRAYGIKNLAESSMIDEMYAYAQNEDEWKNHSDEQNLYSRGFYAPMYVNLGLKTETGILTGADEAEFNSMDTIDGINEYLTFETDGPRNVNNEVHAVTNWIIQDMYNQIKDTYKIMAHQKGSSEAGAEKFGQQKADEFMKYINNIKKIVSRDVNNKSKQELENNMNDVIAVMPADAYGTVEMREGLINVLTSIFNIEKTQKNLMDLGYDINGNQTKAYQKTAEKIIDQKSATESNFTAGSNVLFGNERTMINNEFNYLMPFKKLDMNLNVQANPTFGKNGFDSSTQILAGAGIQTKTNHAGWNFNANIGTGTEIFYTDGATFVLDGNVGANWQVPNSNITLGAKVGASYNVSKAFGDISAMLTATFKNRWCNITVGVGYVQTITKDKTTIIPTTPRIQTPTTENPPYGTEETTEEQPTNTTNMGDDITQIPDKSF